MSCERCGGLMVIETCCDLMKEEAHKGIDTTRCLNCGNFEDTIIRTNRARCRLPGHCEPRTTGTRIQSANQLRSLKRGIHAEPVIAECPRGSAPRLPVGTPFAKTWRRGPAHIEQSTPIVQAKRKYA
jgi:hypothetical protein